jgi:hypothetical protein
MHCIDILADARPALRSDDRKVWSNFINIPNVQSEVYVPKRQPRPSLPEVARNSK